jgi:hypothetical protein
MESEGLYFFGISATMYISNAGSEAVKKGE